MSKRYPAREPLSLAPDSCPVIRRGVPGSCVARHTGLKPGVHGKPEARLGSRFHRAQSAFSLIEILVAIALLTFIVLGLLVMFNQTQRAFRASMAQTDILESGRIVTDMVAREIEQASPSRAEPMVVNSNPYYETTNFFVEMAPTFLNPSVQGLPGSTSHRTNVVRRFFFMTRYNNEWIGTGYTVLQDAGLDAGTLYRFEVSKKPPFSDYDMGAMFRFEADRALANILNDLPVTNLSRVAAGVVHFQVRTFAPNGQPLIPFVGSNLVVRLPHGDVDDFDDVLGTYYRKANEVLPLTAEFANYDFVGEAVPASVELEIGILEQNILGRYKALDGNPVAQRNYLSNHVANVHIFRQRIPIRNVDPSVYP